MTEMKIALSIEEAAAFPKLKKIKFTLDKHNNLIFEAERERNEPEIELSDLKGLARLTKKKELETWILENVTSM